MSTIYLQRDTTISRLLSDLPGLIPLFMQKHMGCVGCCMAQFDTIEDAALAHGFQPECLLAELREYIAPLGDDRPKG